jgi:hypothetical protein
VARFVLMGLEIMFKKIKMVKEVKTQKYKPGLGPNNQNT